MKTALVVIDMQNGFMTPSTKRVIEPIKTLCTEADRRGFPVVFTRFINYPESGWVRWIRWSRFMTSPEIDIIPEFSGIAKNVFDKKAYGAFIPAFSEFLEKLEIQRIILCGVATDGCVLKTAVDAFERGIQPIIVSDACASHAGEDIHNAGLLLVSRFIGKRQVLSLQEVIRQGFDVQEFAAPIAHP